ncbi:MAG TPA: [LysW]-aminoadipate kinase, partial [Thermomicrobiales bacterium]|nr:[LysW]-aminoadipate kinase [Thermomicrobiales bacterium]
MLVIKLGGSAGIDPATTLDDLATLWPGERIVFVHGANAALDVFQRQVGHEPRLVISSSGQVSRFTDQATMDDLLAIYAGRVNKRLVEGLRMRGVNAVGLTALDGGIASGPRKDTIRVVEDGKPKVLRGDYAGSIREIDTRLIDLLLDNGYLPVLTPPAVSLNGEAINVDGDKLSLRLAEALKADAMVLLVREIDVADPTSVDAAMAAAGGRMKKKVQAGIDAVAAGIGRVVFADARVERPVSRALAGEGTVVGTRDAGGRSDDPSPMKGGGRPA